MKILNVLLSSLMFCAGLFAQSAKPISPDVPPENAPPMIIFSQEWPESTPPFFTIGVGASGRATYRSTQKDQNEGMPYDLKFVMSEGTRDRLFDLAKKANYFHGDFDYKKTRVAFTGTKTLVFQNGKEINRTVYNYSSNPAIQDITKIFQSVSETIELGRLVAEKYRYDKLGVDAELKKLEQAAKDDRTAELQTIQPLLEKIAKDPSVMNISRRRAAFLLSKLPKAGPEGGQF